MLVYGTSATVDMGKKVRTTYSGLSRHALHALHALHAVHVTHFVVRAAGAHPAPSI